jgi:hypothetical protein
MKGRLFDPSLVFLVLACSGSLCCSETDHAVGSSEEAAAAGRRSSNEVGSDAGSAASGGASASAGSAADGGQPVPGPAGGASPGAGWDCGEDATLSFAECSGGGQAGRTYHGRPMANLNRKAQPK